MDRRNYSKWRTNFQNWQKRNQSLAYVFGNEVERVFKGSSFDSYFHTSGQHPKILKEYLKGNVSIETLVILDKVLGYVERFDKKILDPIWGAVSMKIKKYGPFLNIDVPR